MNPKSRPVLGPSPAERLLWEITTPDGADRKFRRPLLNGLPEKFRMPTAREYLAIAQRLGRGEANLWLLDRAEGLSPLVYRLASDEDALRAATKRRAADFRRLTIQHSPEQAYRLICHYVAALGAKPPTPSRMVSLQGAIARLSDERWWRRVLRQTCGRKVESFAIEIGQVHRGAGIYASDEAVARRRTQKARNRALLEATTAVNELDQEYTLQQLAELSVSNPHVRRSELMARIVGFESIALQMGHDAVFITLTCPSRMHAWRSDGHKNSTYDGTTPRKAQKYLNKQWAKARSALQRRGICPYGFRIVEPHHDGTPHWHLLLFIEPGHCEPLIAVIRRYALQVDGDEPGAELHRVKVENIDPAKGSAAGYVVKYISKNIDGHGLDHDFNGHDPVKRVERIEAWASTWGIRQFQQIGGPPVTVYRELRRVHTETGGVLEEARRAADAGDWASYTLAMGGPQTSRKTHPIRLAKMYNDKPGRYGDPLGWQVYGVEAGSVIVPTRLHEWRIRNTSSGQQLVPKDYAGQVNYTYRLPPYSYNGVASLNDLKLRIDPCITGAPLYNGGNGELTGTDPCITGARHRRDHHHSINASPWSSVNNCTRD